MPSGTAENVLLAAWSETLSRFENRRAILGVADETLRTFADIERESREMEMLFDGLLPRTVVAIRMENRP